MQSKIDSFALQDDENSNSHLQKQQINDIHQSKKKKKIFWIYLFLLTLFVAISLVLISQTWQPTIDFASSDQFYFANQVTSEWKNGFIVQVLVTKSTDCPDNFQHAINYEWPGYGYGCYCERSQNLSFVLQGYCLPSLIQYNCTNMLNVDETTAHLWRNQSNICLRRSTVSFFNEQKYDGSNKVCGSADSLVIVPMSQPCPYVNMSFSPFTLQNNVVNAIDVDSVLPSLQSIWNSTSPYSFYAYPIGKLRVNEHQICQIDEDYGITNGHSDFVLLNLQMGCQKVGNFTIIDTINQTDFYANNSNLQALTAVQGFPTPGSWQYNLGFSSVPSWRYQCRHNYDNRFTITQSIEKFNFEFNSIYNVLVIVQIIVCVIIIFCIFILALRRCMNNFVYPIGYKQKNLVYDFNIALIRYIVDGIAKLILFSLILAITYLTYQNWSWFKAAINQDCADGNQQMINDILVPYQLLYWGMFNYSLGLFCLTILMIVIDIIHFRYVYLHELQYYLIDNGNKLVQREESQEFADLKWIQDQHQHQNINQNMNDQFRITMAHNIFAEQMQSQSKIVKMGKKNKKTKKKIFSLSKKTKEENKQFYDYQNIENQFNPYMLNEEDSIEPINSQSRMKNKNKKKYKK